MGIIIHRVQNKRVVLAAHSVVGRSPTSIVRLRDPLASNEHASISWNGERWEVRDLGSTNGTWVQHKPLPIKERAHLVRGSLLQFASETEQWELVDDEAPVVVAYSRATGNKKVAVDGLLALPDETDVWVSIVQDAEARWFVETREGETRSAMDGESIAVGQDHWELEVPPAGSTVGTRKATMQPSIEALTLRFQISHDGDHVGVELVQGDWVHSLGTKTRFDLLYPLAIARLDDAREPALKDEDHGWRYVQDLAQKQGISEKNLNVILHRIRQELAKVGVEGAKGIFERRPKQVRLGTDRILGL